MKKILSQSVIRARDQNKVFVEKANRRRLSPGDAVDRYGLAPGKANAYVEFDIEEELLDEQINDQNGICEWYIVGDVALDDRNAEGFINV